MCVTTIESYYEKTYHPEPPYRLKQSVWLLVRLTHKGIVRHLDQYTETEILCQHLFILFSAKDLLMAFSALICSIGTKYHG